MNSIPIARICLCLAALAASPPAATAKGSRTAVGTTVAPPTLSTPISRTSASGAKTLVMPDPIGAVPSGYRFGRNAAHKPATGEVLPPVQIPGVPRPEDCPCAATMRDRAAMAKILPQLTAALLALPPDARSALETLSRQADAATAELRKTLEQKEMTSPALVPLYLKLAVDPVRAIFDALAPFTKPGRPKGALDTATALRASFGALLTSREKLADALKADNRAQIDAAREAARCAACELALVSHTLQKTSFAPRRPAEKPKDVRK